MPQQLSQSDLIDICAGACVLGSGGGGSYVVSKRVVKMAIQPTTTVSVVNPSELDPESYLCVCADMGAPHLAFSRPSTYAASNAVSALAELFFQLKQLPAGKFGAVLPIEVGAISTAVAIVAASEHGIVAVDADGAGRSVPRLEMLVYSAYGEKLGFTWFPTCVATDSDPGTPFNSGYIRISGASPAVGAEGAFFGLASSAPFGSLCGLAMWPMQAKTIQQHSPALGTITDALAIGRMVQAGASGASLVSGIQQYLASGRPAALGARQSRMIFHGYVSNMVQKAGSLDIGQIVIGSEPDGSGEQLMIFYQNENLLASLVADPTQPFIMGPDTIAVIPAAPVGSPGQSVTDNSDLFNLWSWGVRPLEVYVMGIEAPAIATGNKTLVESWLTTLRGMVGYAGPFVQPWLTSGT